MISSSDYIELDFSGFKIELNGQLKMIGLHIDGYRR